jgi:hypothetical protein
MLSLKSRVFTLVMHVACKTTVCNHVDSICVTLGQTRIGKWEVESSNSKDHDKTEGLSEVSMWQFQLQERIVETWVECETDILYR